MKKISQGYLQFSLNKFGVKRNLKKFNTKILKLPQSKNSSNPSITLDIINKAFKQLFEHELYQDAIILHLMYSLSIPPTVIETFTFDNLCDDKSFLYYDPYEHKCKSIILNDDLYSQLLYYKMIKQRRGIKNRQSCRKSLDKKLINGDFIFSINSRAMYKRFQGKFDNKIQWFNYTPNDIVKFSIQMKRQSID